MRQLTGLDTSFLSIETARQFGHVASLTVYEADVDRAPGAFYASFVKTLEQRLHLLPVLRRKLVTVPFGLDHPYWIDDADFDLDFHVRETAVAPPGNDQQLGELVARLVARPLDRSHPLWEAWVIEGLPDGRVALLQKVHHATIDGVQGVEMLTTLLDIDPAGRKIEPPQKAWKGEAEPSTGELMARTAINWSRNPARAIRMQRQLFSTVTGLRERTGLAGVPAALGLTQIPGLGEALAKFLPARPEQFPLLASGPAPKTSFNKAITAHRRFAFRSFPIEDAKVVRRAYGVTLNDVVMAISAGMLRDYLAVRNELPAESLVAMVPVSIRTESEADLYSNRVATVLCPLHTNIADPVERLMAIHHSMKSVKEMQAAVPADLLTNLAHFAPPAVLARASRIVTRSRVADRMNPPFNVVISNVPGPNIPLYIAGNRLQHFYPVSTIVDGQGLNITVQSYMGNLDFGLVTCRELVGDPWVLTDGLDRSLAELLSAAASTMSASAAVPPRKARSASKRPKAAKAGSR
jgi:diacylglycerol O-acyltransferase / wax synthase